MDSYLIIYNKWLKDYNSKLSPNSDVIEVAREVASSFLTSNSNFYTVDVLNTGFGRELGSRSGGLASLKPLVLETVSNLTSADVILAEDTGVHIDKQIEVFKEIISKKAKLILISSMNSKILESITPTFHIDNLLDKSPYFTFKNEYCPMDTVVNITVAWVFIIEFINFCRKRNKMPVMYASILIDGGPERAGTYKNDGFFHKDGEFAVKSVEPNTHSITYTNILSGYIDQILATQSNSLNNAIDLFIETKNTGGSVWFLAESHIISAQFNVIGNPNFFTYLNITINDKNYKTILSKENVLTYLGYFNYPNVLDFFVWRGNANSVWLQGGLDKAPIVANKDRIVIDQVWKYGDSIIRFFGYDIDCIPPSGIIQTALFWELNWQFLNKN